MRPAPGTFHLRSSLEKLDCLRRNVDTIRAAISDSSLEERQVAGECFLLEIAAAVYDAEDVLYDYWSRKEQDSLLRKVCICFPAALDTYSNMEAGRKFNRVEERIHTLLRSNVTRRPPVVEPITSFVIGRDNDKEKVMGFLFEKKPMVLAIVGIKGIGKTTLAQLVFSDERVSSQFEMRLWFTVKPMEMVGPCLVDIVNEILLQTGAPAEALNFDSDRDLIQLKLRQVVEDKRFLLVLDGLEDQDLWEELYSLLNGVYVSHGSKILLTSVNPILVPAEVPVHVLKQLSKEDSLSLLMNIAPGDKVYEWGNILYRCAGVPLAIVTAAMNLWTSRHTIHGVRHRSILLALKTSYDSLPSHLKEFVAYCSLFPRDYVFSVRELVSDYVLPTLSTLSLLALGDSLPSGQELVRSDLASLFNFLDIIRDEYENIIGFRMRPLLHDLARFVNKGFCTYVEKSDFLQPLSENNLHVSFSGVLHHDDLLNQLQRANNARVLIFVDGAGYLVREPELECIFKNLKKLRNLRIQNLPVSALSNLLGTLKYLWHLDLSESVQLAALPVSIGNLFYLQTLILRSCCSLKELPSSICQLFKLRKLDLSGCSSLTHLPSRIVQLRLLEELDLSGCSSLTHLPTGLSWLALQILGLFVIGKEEARNAASLNECRYSYLKGRLEIKHLHRVTDNSIHPDILEDKPDLQSLKFCWDSFDVISHGKRATADFVLKQLQPHPNLKEISIQGYCGHDADGLSNWLSRLTNLIKIEIGDCNWCTSLTPLHTLPYLKSVKLSEMRELEYFGTLESSSSEGFFPALEELSFKYMPKLKGWQRKSIISISSAEEEEVETNEWDDLTFPTFAPKIHLDVDHTRSFSYAHGRDSLILGTLTDRILGRWLGNNNKGKASSSKSVYRRVTPFTSICSISLSQLRTVKIQDMGDITSLPEQLLQQLSSLQHLEISHGRFLTTLSGMVILQHLTALETLILVDFPELEFSTENDKELGSGKLKGRSKLRRVRISAVPKMKSLPLWFQHLTELEELVISDCVGLRILLDDPIFSKFSSLRSFEISGCRVLRFSKTVILHLITTLESLKICGCPELDLTARPAEEDSTWRLQPPSRLRRLHIQQVNNKMQHLPWWIQHLGSLEILEILSCKNLEILPNFLTKLGSLREIRIEYCGKLSEWCGAKRISVTSIYDLPRISRSPMMRMLFKASEAAKRSRKGEYKVLIELYSRFGEAKDTKEQHKRAPGFGSSLRQHPVRTFLRSLNPIANKRVKRRQELHGNWPTIEMLKQIGSSRGFQA